VGDDSKIRFWHDILCRVLPLKGAFLELFSTACLRDAFVADNLHFSNGSHQWNINFVRSTHDWELEFFTSFFDKLYSISLRQNGVDKLYWIPSKSRRFEISLFYNVLVPLDSTHFPWRCIWQSNAPLRVAFFAWTATLGKILTLDNLRK
jgi:hypothetical protein